MECASCERLREEIQFLRSDLGLVQEETDLSRLKEVFGLMRSSARLLMALYRAKGRLLLSWQLADLFETSSDSTNVVSVHVSAIRKALGRGSVINSRSQGFRLSKEGLGLVDAALSGTLLGYSPDAEVRAA